MCGVLGIVMAGGRALSVSDGAVERMREVMTHRGPDGAGLWRRDGAALAHRRLAVIDPTPAGAQPMLTPNERYALVYNGELYNDADVRRDLEREGVVFRTKCDTETVLHALATWGEAAPARLRGMYAFGFYDAERRRLLLARDPLGVKPLYVHATNERIVFASEIPAILAHPEIDARPNLRMISAYLTTIRTALGNDTMYDGVMTLAPGQCAVCDCSGDGVRIELTGGWRGPASVRVEDGAGAVDVVRAAVEESVRLHLRSDVPTCALLSGGLDSTITATLAARTVEDLRTYCAGCPAGGDGEPSDDLGWARLAAARIGSKHAEAHVDAGMFLERWRWMIGRLGVPLSTPNEVAIYAVAERLREDGCVVTVSGEGADELFGGYDVPLETSWAYAMRHPAGEGAGLFQLASNAWVPMETKAAAINGDVWRACDGDAGLAQLYEAAMAECAEEAGAEAHPAERHLRFLRRVNLTGLLQRLDTATMLASVEGRTPYADARVAAVAEALPMSLKFHAGSEDGEDLFGEGAAARRRTKIALREAFGAVVPEGIARRAKASFPLPFQAWMGGTGETLRKSAFAREVLSGAVIEDVANDPATHWRWSWPMLNVAVWGDAVWG